ncbi:MAG: aldehyde dehydrogenase family protein, partial [Solirubrobacteraceae bacterium]
MAQAQSAGPAQVGSVRQEQIESRSPATGRLLGTVAATAPQRVADEVAAAREVQPLWALLRIADRARYVRAMAQAMIDELDEIVQTLCAEQGRPAAEVAALEALAAVDALIWIADSGARALTGRRVPVH